MEKAEGFLIDLDGTLYRGDSPVQGADRFMEWLQAEKRPHLFLTNCPSRTPLQVADKLRGLGIDADPQNVLTSGMIAAQYLKENGFSKVFLVGESAARKALEEQGLQIVSRAPDCVLVSWDRQFSYDTLNRALWVLSADVPLYCTNPDETIPDGPRRVAHTGAICAAVERASGRQALYLGKPGTEAGKIASRMLGIPCGRLCVIGDRTDMDIRFAKNNDMQSVLTLTGGMREEDIPQDCRPDRVVATLDQLIGAV